MKSYLDSKKDKLLLSKKWIFQNPIEKNQAEEIARRINILPLTATILLQRGLDEAQIRSFLNPGGLRFCDYKMLPGVETAGGFIAEAIRNKEKIFIFGDYDVDGITSAAVISEFIRSRGGDLFVHLPDRVSEGYGLNLAFINKAVEQKAKLLVTVDCGITAIAEIALAKEKGLKVVVTDHHEPGPVLPQADAIVDPKATGPDELMILAGVGVAMQVVRATATALGETNPELLRQHLDLVALGTIADVVPLIGENRLLARSGISVINRGHRIGLKTLISEVGLGPEPLNSTDLAFRITPRLNAAGRMGDAKHSLDLLLANDANEANALAQWLNKENSRRQSTQKLILEEAEQQLNLSALPKVLVVWGDEWPHGVVGLVAARLCEKFHRPCFAISVVNGIGKGSGRSIFGFPLHQKLENLSSMLQKWGGHAMAAGVTLAQEKLDAFSNGLNELAETELDEDKLRPELHIDVKVELEDFGYKLIHELKKFEPFGFGNTKPLFAINQLRLSGPARVVGEKHLKLKVSDNKNLVMDVIGFGLGNRIEELTRDKTIDIAGYPDVNHWNGSSTLQIEMKDFKIS